MRHEIALWTEWAWSQGLIEHDKELASSWAQFHVAQLQRRFAKHMGHPKEAIEEITQEILKSLQKLTYGKRQPQDLHPKRRYFLENEMPQTLVWLSLPKIVRPLLDSQAA
jgi:hypothetical protein